jgi:hypothetical protein
VSMSRTRRTPIFQHDGRKFDNLDQNVAKSTFSSSLPGVHLDRGIVLGP